MVVSLIALFVALGGTSYAAITLPKNSVGTKQIKNDAVTASKLSSSAGGKVKIVGKAGAPAYENSWVSAHFDYVDEGVSFYKDAWGIVHLQGQASNSSAVQDTIFTLPPGYRPAGNVYFSVYGDFGTAAYIRVAADGTVSTFAVSQDFVGLGNVTFRAGL
jgi:hypothetical protein